MKKVILYGINNRANLARIGQLLSEEFEVIGFVDSKDSERRRFFSNKPLFSIKDIVTMKVDFDYIILASGSQDSLFKTKLIRGGVYEERILEWTILREFMFENNMVLYKKRRMNYEGMVFGMSHSYWGLFTYRLSKPFFKFSAPAMDLFFINKQLQEVINENYLGKSDGAYRSNLKYIILEFPYYYFNYDMSRNKTHMRRQMILADYFGDTHNFGETVEDQKIIVQYYVWKEMFYDRLKYNSSYCYSDHILRNGNITQDMINTAKTSISHVWDKEHKETIEENIDIFNNMIKLINNFDKKIKIIILVMPQSKYDSLFHFDEVEKTRHYFLTTINEIMSKYDNPYFVWDLYKDYFEKENLFLDCIHLNSAGADFFSTQLEEKLKKIY